MLQDDRVMSILTGLVIVVAMATLAQRSDSLLDFVMREEAPKITPQNDEVVMFAGDSRIIDVLENDENALPESRENVRIVVSPSCGAAEATSEGVLYISNDLCVGPQLFAYCVQQGDECPSASVTVNVAAAAPGALRLATNDGAATRNPINAPQSNVAAAPTRSQAPVQTTQSTQQVARATAPQIRDNAAAPQISTSGAGLAPVATQQAPAVQRNTVVAAVRPAAPVQSPVGRLGAAPQIDDGSVAAPAPSLRTLSDDSEPRLSLAPVARPRFTDAEDASPTIDRASSGQSGNVQVAALPNPTADTDADRGEQPDVSGIATEPSAPQTPLTEVARLQEPSEGDTATSIRNDAVDAARQGAAPRARTASTTTSRQPTAGCGPVAVRSVASAGASSIVDVSSACRASTPFVLEHANLLFGGRLDANGEGRITIPVMAENGVARVTFPDGSGEGVILNYNWRELELTLRVAVSWSDPVDLDLHAFEYAAPFGGDGHVWEDSPSGFRRVRRSGGGYLANFPATVEGGQSVEVYTFWANSRARRGVARIALDHASRGDVPDGAYCDDGALASPEYMVVRSERGDVKSTVRGRFSPATCGLALTPDVRYASGALRDLRID